MRQALLIIDVQPSFNPPKWLIDSIRPLLGTCPTSPPSNATTNPERLSRNNLAGTPLQTTTA